MTLNDLITAATKLVAECPKLGGCRLGLPVGVETQRRVYVWRRMALAELYELRRREG